METTLFVGLYRDYHEGPFLHSLLHRSKLVGVQTGNAIPYSMVLASFPVWFITA